MNAKVIIAIISSTLLGSCDYIGDHNCNFNMYNGTNHDIAVYWAVGSVNQPTEYPDTTLPGQIYLEFDHSSGETDGEEGYPLDAKDFLFGPGEQDGFSIVGTAFSTEHVFSRLKSDTLSVFIIHGDTIRKHSWKEIQEKYNILARYDLSFKDVKKLGGWCIPFPPTERMKSMHMFPPYEELTRREGGQ